MTLGSQQELFASFVPALINQAYVLEYKVRGGEWWRSAHEAAWDAQQHLGIKRSLHTIRLAIDLLLFKDGMYLTKTEDYTPLGLWWEQQHVLARWGGRFSDGNHFSMTWEGVR